MGDGSVKWRDPKTIKPKGMRNKRRKIVAKQRAAEIREKQRKERERERFLQEWEDEYGYDS